MKKDLKIRTDYPETTRLGPMGRFYTSIQDVKR